MAQESGWLKALTRQESCGIIRTDQLALQTGRHHRSVGVTLKGGRTMEEIDLGRIERNVFRDYSQDGLVDVLFAFVLFLRAYPLPSEGRGDVAE